MTELSRTKIYSIGNEVTEPRRSGESSYALSRNYAATTRLNCQHLLWKLELGWSLHPSLQARILTAQPIVTAPLKVPAPTVTSSTHRPDPFAAQPDTFRIADVATGTAIWALEISQDFPSTQIDGFDIDLQQCPRPEWLPHNVKVRNGTSIPIWLRSWRACTTYCISACCCWSSGTMTRGRF